MTKKIDYEANVVKKYRKFVNVMDKLRIKQRELRKIEVAYNKAYAEYEKAADLYIKNLNIKEVN